MPPGAATSLEMVYEMAISPIYLGSNCLYCQSGLTTCILSHIGLGGFPASEDCRPTERRTRPIRRLLGQHHPQESSAARVSRSLAIFQLARTWCAELTLLPRTGLSAVLSIDPLTDECFLRAHYAELVSLRVGQNGPGLGAGLTDVHPARPERKKAVDLLVAVGGAAG